MSRFTDTEREKVEQSILIKGERLFCEKGLKTVTVDEIAEASGIGKGTFYHFYTNKEHLYMTINNRIQQQIFNEIAEMLDKDQKSSKDKLYSLVHIVLDKFMKYPMISNINGSVYERLIKKSPKVCIEQNDKMDEVIIKRAAESGIRFKYPINQITKLLQVTFLNASSLMSQGEIEVADLLLNAICNNIVEDK